MSINLLQHKDELLKAYNSVIDPKNETNWALFTYDGNSNTLKVLDTGDGGLEEIGNNFNSGKIMYALCQVIEPTTGLPKLMLIHWQGEGVGTTRLGSCASHIYEVQKFFKGVHLTHNARNEDDVEPDVLMSAVKKVSYGAKIIPTSQSSKEPSYVGSVYERVNPGRDINTSERDKFWSLAEKEEVARIEEEKRRVSAEKQRVDDEKRRLQERLTDECQKDIAEVKRKSIGGTSESLRKERLQEVKDVIKPTSNLKAMWEQKTNIPQPESPVATTDDVVVRSVVKKPWPPMPSRESFEQPENQRLSYENGSKLSSPGSPKAFSPTVRSPVRNEAELENRTRNGSHTDTLPSTYHEDVTPPAMSPPPTVDKSYQNQAPFKTSLPPRMPDSDEEQEQEQDWESPPLEDQPVIPVAPLSSRRSTGDHETKNPALGRQAKALWDYEAGDETEITFDPGDIITHIEFIDEGWWRGRGPDGKFGLFPSNYVELLE